MLTYHSVDTSGSIISISPKVFKRQMEYLSEKGYGTVTLNRLLEESKGEINKKTMEKTCALTFDDGFKSVYEIAFPILKDLCFTATVFLVTKYMGNRCLWEKDKSIPDLPLMTWKHVDEMSTYGIEFGAHSVSHLSLTEINAEQAKNEIAESKRELESHLGKTVNFFCYPYGNYNLSIKKMVELSGFKGACTTDFGRWNVNQDWYLIKRLGLNRISAKDPVSQMLFFKGCLNGSAKIYQKLKVIISKIDI